MFQATDSVDNTNSVHHWNHSNLEFWRIAWLDRAVEDFCKTWFKKQNRGLSLDFGSSGEVECFLGFFIFFPSFFCHILKIKPPHHRHTDPHPRTTTWNGFHLSAHLFDLQTHTDQSRDAKRRDLVEKEESAKRLSPRCMKVWRVTLFLEGSHQQGTYCVKLTKIFFAISQVNQ